MEYEQSDLLKWLRNRAILEESDATTWQLNHAADTIERQAKDMDAGRDLMRQAWHVFNGIRAADGAPYGYTHEWWDGITEAFNDLLGGDTVPWMTGAAQALINPLIKEIQDEQYTRFKAEQERDAALAEVERLKGELRDTRWDRDAMTARHKQAQTKIKRLEQELAALKTVTDWQDREIKKEEIAAALEQWAKIDWYPPRGGQ